MGYMYMYARVEKEGYTYTYTVEPLYKDTPEIRTPL